MDFRGFVISVINKDIDYFKDINTIKADYSSKVSTSNVNEFLQLIEFNVLIKFNNFLLSLKQVANSSINDQLSALDKISKDFDNGRVSAIVYSYFLFCGMQLLKNISFIEPISWYDPRSSFKTSNNMLTLGVGAYRDENVTFQIQNGDLIKANFNQPLLKIPEGVKSIKAFSLSQNNSQQFALIVPNSITDLSERCFQDTKNLFCAIISKNVKRIPNYAFYNCQSLGTVIAENVKEIGDYSFYNSGIVSLKFLNLDIIEKIGKYAFSNCTKLTSLSLGNAKLDYGIFAGCEKLESLSLSIDCFPSNSVFRDLFATSDTSSQQRNFSCYLKKLYIKVNNGIIPKNFFRECRNLEEVHIVGQINLIGENAFANCDSLKSVEMIFNGDEIKDAAFDNCSSLIKLPNFPNVEKIGDKAFYNCSSLTDLKIANIVKSIGSSAFENCKSLSFKNLRFNCKVIPDSCFANCANLDVNEILKNVEVLSKNSLVGANFHDSLTIPSSIKSIAPCAFGTLPTKLENLFAHFENVSNLKEVGILSGLSPKYLYIYDCDFSKIYDDSSSGLYRLFSTSIDNFNKYYSIENTMLTNCTLSRGFLKNSKALQKVVLNNVKQISDSCFENCTSLTSVFTNTKLSLGNECFKNCLNFKKFISGSKKEEDCVDLRYVTSCGNNVFLNCPSISKMYLNFNNTCSYSNIKKLSELFINLGGLDLKNNKRNVNGLICGNNFANVEIDKLTLLNTTYIPDHLLDNCKQINEVVFSQPISKVGAYAFNNFGDTSRLKLTYIGNVLPSFSFAGCSNLNGNSLFKNVIAFGDSCFKNSKFADQYELPQNAKYIGEESFAGSNIFCNTLTLSSGLMIKKSGLEGLNPVTLNIYSLDFLDGKKLFELFNANLEEFNKLSKIKSIKVDGSLLQTSLFEGWRNIENVEISNDITKIPAKCFKDCESLTSVNIQSHVSEIDNDAFYGCVNLKSLSLSTNATGILDLTGIKSIGNNAFYDCKGITNICLKDAEYVQNCAFNSCTNIKSICIASRPNQTNLYSLFAENLDQFNNNFTLLSDITVDFKSGKIPSHYFEGCTNVKNIKIDNNVFEIGKGAFKNCLNLENLNIDCQFDILPSECFYNCSKLDICFSLDSIKQIGELSLYGVHLTKEQYITLMSNVQVFEKDCFSNVILPEAIHVDKILIDKDKVYYRNIFTNLTFDIVEINCDKFMEYDNAQYDVTELFSDNKINAKRLIIGENVNSNNLSKLLTLAKECNEIEINCNMPSLQDYLFYGYTSLKRISFKYKINEIGKSCFENDINLSDITIGESKQNINEFDKLNIIGEKAFYNCKSLTNLSFTDLNKCGNKAFGECSNLISIRINSNVFNNISFNDVFYSSDLSDKREVELLLNSDKLDSIFKDVKDVKSIKINGNIQNISDYAFYNCESLLDLELNFIGSIIPEHCFENCSNLRTELAFNKAKIIKESAFKNCCSLNKVTLDELTFVGNSAFENCELLDCDLNIKSSVIGDYAFRNDIRLSSLTFKLPFKSGLESFAKCNSLNHLYISGIVNNNIKNTFPDSISSLSKIDFANTRIENNFFEDLSNLIEIKFEKEIIFVGSYAFANCTSLLSLPMLNNVKSICSYAFFNSGIKKLIINPEVTYLGASFLSQMQNLKYLSVPLIDSRIGLYFDNRQFEGSKKIEQIKYRKGTKDIKTFDVYMPESLKEIAITNFEGGEGAFSGLKDVNLTVHGEIKNIPAFCFSNFDGILNNLYWEGINNIGDYAFSNSSIVDFNLVNVNRIGSYALSNLKGLSNLKIGSNIEYLENNFINGSNFENISIGNNSRYMYKDGMLISLFDGVILYVNKNISGDLILPNEVKIIAPGQFSGCNNLNSINTNEVNIIGDNAFDGCTNLTSLVITNSTKEIGNAILRNSNKIVNLSLPFIGKRSTYCSDLTYLFDNTEIETLNLQVLGGYITKDTFKNCNIELFSNIDLSLINQLILPNNVFDNLIIDTLILPDCLKKVSPNIFTNSIVKTVVSKNIKTDDNFVYDGDSIIYALGNDSVTIEIPANIKYINENAFSFFDNKPIKSLTILPNNILINGAFKKMMISELVTNSEFDYENELSSSHESLTSLKLCFEKCAQFSLNSFTNLSFIDLSNIKIVNSFLISNLPNKLDEVLFGDISLIESDAFSTNHSFKLINFNCIDCVETNAFKGANIEKIIISNDCKYYMLGELLVDKTEQKILYCCHTSTDIIIENDSIIAIEPYAFLNVLAKIYIKLNNLENIGDFAFENCSNIEKLYLGPKLTFIGEEILHNSKVKDLCVNEFSKDLINKPTSISKLFYNNSVSVNKAKVDRLILTNWFNISNLLLDNLSANTIFIIEGIGLIDKQAFSDVKGLQAIYISKKYVVSDFAFLNCDLHLSVFTDGKKSEIKKVWRRNTLAVAEESKFVKLISLGFKKYKKASAYYKCNDKEFNHESLLILNQDKKV